MSRPLRILFLAAEATPFIKVGGLADVAGSLPKALNRLESGRSGNKALDVRLVIPHYPWIKSDGFNFTPLIQFQIKYKKRYIKVNVSQVKVDGVIVYLINGEPISSSSSVYTSDEANDQFKFTFFSLAAVELTRILNWQVDLLHANDWHTALAIYAIRCGFRDDFFFHTATMMTVHNLSYMGGDLRNLLTGFGLTRYTGDNLPTWSRNQPMPLGLLAADEIVPVSKTYSREILTPEFGCGLDEYLNCRRESITGIVNGLDTLYWDPKTDELIQIQYDRESIEKKQENKILLQQLFNLPVDDQIPLMSMVTRLDNQKGVDLVIQALIAMSRSKWQFVILGMGDPLLENELLALKARYPKKIGLAFRFDNPLSHQIYAGADILLMPSRFEPCGLSQMIAMRYGALPIVTRTGGLQDTVQDGKTGFFIENAIPGSLATEIKHVFRIYKDKNVWRKMQKNAMRLDLSWEKSAKKYAAIYLSLVKQKKSGGES